MKLIILIGFAMLIGSLAFAQEAPVITDPAPTDTHVTPTEPTGSGPVADSEDGSKKNKKNHTKKARKANFGAIVSAEAHRLKREGLNGTQKMGPWVSNQRRQNDQKNADAGDSHGASKSRRK
jgi:hypothetical protein